MWWRDRGDEAPHPLNRESIAATQAIAGFHEQARERRFPTYFVISASYRGAGCPRKPPYFGGSMKSFALSVRRFLKSEDGPTAVEYAVMLALIIIVCLTAITAIGTKASTTFSNVAASIGGAS
jgi:pilus assembly protein Flp/PilA